MPQRRHQARLFWQAMTAFERRLQGAAGRARNAILLTAARKYVETGTVPAWIDETHRRRIESILSAHYAQVIPHFGEMATRQIKSRTFETKADLLASLTQQWIKREALRKATRIAATDRQDVADAIADGIAEGLGTAEIARSIRKVSTLTPSRAALIARTETHAAATYGSIESVRDAEQQLGVVMLKAWLPTVDDRTRPEHAAMINHPAIPLDEKFNVGGEQMDRPGDPSASAENTIACRCALIYEEAGD